mmetsp:Transcript_70715/g.223885  ORF Transcript_70715/g.223885 Transcript_70715/m.223885 type:complete len:202 (+) Transcript_70715:417-1022(+)
MGTILARRWWARPCSSTTRGATSPRWGTSWPSATRGTLARPQATSTTRGAGRGTEWGPGPGRTRTRSTNTCGRRRWPGGCSSAVVRTVLGRCSMGCTAFSTPRNFAGPAWTAATARRGVMSWQAATALRGGTAVESRWGGTVQRGAAQRGGTIKAGSTATRARHTSKGGCTPTRALPMSRGATTATRARRFRKRTSSRAHN